MPSLIDEPGIDLVVLARYMRILSNSDSESHVLVNGRCTVVFR